MLLVQEEMKTSPFEAALFVFCNVQRLLLKAVYWDRNGILRIQQPPRRRNRTSVRNGKRLPEGGATDDLPKQDKQCACGHSLVRIGEDCAP